MKKLLIGLPVAVALCLSAAANADSVSEVWECELKDDATIEDVQAANSKWLKIVNEKVDGGGITSAVGNAIVGDLDGFVFIDTYPDIVAWAAAKKLFDGDGGDELDELFDELSECEQNSLWKIEPTK